MTPAAQRHRRSITVCAFVAALSACAGTDASDASDPPTGDAEWTELFDGRSLEGWIPKIRGERAGEDSRRTFRVVDGLLTVDYSEYDAEIGFDDTFGHLFYESPFESYELLVEYRFVGDQFTGGPGWARMNSGVMFHAQDPATMGVNQDFPVSLEVQYLGGTVDEVRPTANLCTPGTHVVIDDALVTEHCIGAGAPTIPRDSWVSTTLVVRPDGTVRHLVEGEVVLEYGGAVVGGGEVNDAGSTRPPEDSALRRGYIALQSESHPIHFRRVAIRPVREIP